MPKFDAIIVPGGGVRGSAAVPAWVELRLEKALELADGAPIITLSAGTTHKSPPREPNGWPVLEAVAMARYLRDRGYPSELVWAQGASFDTLGDAYFTRLLHTEPAGLRKLMIVTSSFHLPRTEAIFRWVFALDPPVLPYDLSFAATPHGGMSREVLEARLEKERDRMATLERLQITHKSLKSLHEWLFTVHGAYAVDAEPIREEVGEKLLGSY